MKNIKLVFSLNAFGVQFNIEIIDRGGISTDIILLGDLKKIYPYTVPIDDSEDDYYQSKYFEIQYWAEDNNIKYYALTKYFFGRNDRNLFAHFKKIDDAVLFKMTFC